MRILLTGGGTGGHTFPLIAIARKIKEIDVSVEILFMGPDSKSINLFKQEGIGGKKIFAPKMRRYFSILNFLDIFKLPIGFLQAYRHLFFYMPDIILSKGGYGSSLVVFVGWLFRIPIFIHESDYIPGVSNKILSIFAKKVFVSFKETLKFFPEGKATVTGNPIRELFLEKKQDAIRDLSLDGQNPVVFIIGGSQGSQQINDLMILAAPDLVRQYEIIHQSGERDYEMVKDAILFRLKSSREKGLYHLYPNLNEKELRNVYAAADIIISRAGSGAVFEIAASGKPSILMPYKPAAGAHQEKNAHAYAKTGAGIVLEDENLTPHLFLDIINSVIRDSKKWRAMSNAALSFSKPQAAAEIARELISSI